MKKKYSIKMRGQKKAEIYIYDTIGDYWFDGISAKQFVKDLNALGVLDQIDVRIYSDGGSVFDGVAIYNALVRNKAKIVTYADSLAASIASVIFMAGEERRIAQNATLMIHNPMGGMFGYADDLRSAADQLDQIRGQIMEAYTQHINIDYQALSDMMDEETWMTAEMAYDMGFATHIDEEMMMAATAKTFDLTKFKHPPENLATIESKSERQSVASDAIRKMGMACTAHKMAASGR